MRPAALNPEKHRDGEALLSTSPPLWMNYLSRPTGQPEGDRRRGARRNGYAVTQGRLIAPMRLHPRDGCYIECLIAARPDHSRINNIAALVDVQRQRHAAFLVEANPNRGVDGNSMRGRDREGRRQRRQPCWNNRANVL